MFLDVTYYLTLIVES